MIQRILLGLVIAATMWVGWHWLFRSDEAQIMAVLERIADGISTGAGNGGGVDALAKAASLRDHLAMDVVVDAGPPFHAMNGRDAIIAAAARVNNTARHLEISFNDISLEVASHRRSATALVTAEARFDEAGGGRSFDARELEIVFTRPEGHWVISAVKLIQPLERLDGR